MVVRVGGHRIEGDCLSKLPHGSVEVALPPEEEAKHAVRRGIAGRSPDRVFELDPGSLDIALGDCNARLCHAGRRRDCFHIVDCMAPPGAGRQPLERLSQTVVGLELLGSETQGVLVGGDGPFRVVASKRLPDLMMHLGQGGRPKAVPHRPPRVPRKDIPELPCRPLALADRPERHAEIHSNLQVVRFERDRGLKRTNRFLHLACFRENRCQAVVGSYQTGLQFDRAPESRDRLSELPSLLKCDAEPVVGRSRVGIPIENRPQLLHGPLPVVERLQKQGQFEPSLLETGIQPHRFLQFEDRLVHPPHVPQGKSQVEPCAGRIGLQFGGLPESLERSLPLVLVAERDAHRDIGLGLVGGQLEHFLELGDRGIPEALLQ